VSPECPCCGGTGARLVQRVNGGLLRTLWKVQFRLDPGPIPTTSLLECDCGLRFFSPARAGDAAFYRAAYARGPLWAWQQRPPQDHADFLAAQHHIGPGDQVLDVGGHGGAFARLMPDGARCTVIDPYGDEDPASGVLRETAAEHARRLPGHYDMVCAFQVIEHVEDPHALATDMLACLRPGGLFILAGPTWPSPLTELPNIAMNAPPHHLSWWSPRAFERFAARLGLRVLEARGLEGTAALHAVYYWLWRLTPTMPPDQAYRHSWWLHGRLALAALLRPLLNAVNPPAARGLSTDALLVARKP